MVAIYFTAGMRMFVYYVTTLHWASTVILGGRLHTRSIYDAISATVQGKHKVKLCGLLPHIQWWHDCSKLENNKCLIWDVRPILHVFTDASSLAG